MVASQSKYTDGYRRETADYIISTGRPIAEVCWELGISDKTAGRCVKERRRLLSGQPDPKAEDAELAALRKRNRELEMENAFLKSRGLLRQGASVTRRYELMLAERANFALTMMAEMLGVSRSATTAGCPTAAPSTIGPTSARRFGASGPSQTGPSATDSSTPSCPTSTPASRSTEC